MKIIICTLLLYVSLISTILQAKEVNGEFSIKEAHLTYHVDFLLKHIQGRSSNVKGRGVCTLSKCQFLIAVPVKSFISKDSNRDTKMRGILKAGAFPMVSLRLNTSSNFLANGHYNLELSFAGQTKVYNHIALKTIVDGSRLKVNGSFNIKLSDFKIERPSLLLVKIEDQVKIDVDITFILLPS